MMRPRTRRAPAAFRPAVDGLEGRELMTGLPPGIDLGGLLGQLPPGFTLPSFPRSTPAEVQAVLQALQAGAANEWLGIVMRQVPNPMGVAQEFLSGARTEYTNRGMAFRVPKATASYVGTAPDEFKALAAGAVVTGRQRLLLGAIVDGPIGDMAAGKFVFGIDRGGPKRVVAGRADTMVDATVTVRMADHKIRDVQVRDLATGRVTTLPASPAKVRGATIQIELNPSLLPSRGLTLGQYRFTFWTVDDARGRIASYVPEGKTVPVAVSSPTLAGLRLR